MQTSDRPMEVSYGCLNISTIYPQSSQYLRRPSSPLEIEACYDICQRLGLPEAEVVDPTMEEVKWLCTLKNYVCMRTW